MPKIGLVVGLPTHILDLLRPAENSFLGQPVFPDARFDVLYVPVVEPAYLRDNDVQRLERTQLYPAYASDADALP